MGYLKYLQYAEVLAFTIFILASVVFTGVFFFYPAGRLLLIPAAVALAWGLRRVAAGGKCNYTADLKGKVAIVTGANSGIGKTCAIALAKMGSHVILACRNLDKANEAVEEVKKASGSEKVESMKLDLSSFRSVREFAKQFQSKNLPCHILLNNAGIMLCPYGLTEDGYETQFATNHLGHFLLTTLLLPILKKSQARIVNVSSFAHFFAKENSSFEEMIKPQQAKYDPMLSYGYSKLANILFTRELQKRLQGTGATAYALHPGAVQTELQRYMPAFARELFSSRFTSLFAKYPAEGCETSLYCCIHPDAKPGMFYTDCVVTEPSAEALSDKRASELWEFSEKLVN